MINILMILLVIFRCAQPTYQPNPTQPAKFGLFLGLGGLGWVTKFFFDSGSGWIWVIKFQTRQIRPDPPIYLIYI